MPEGLEAEIWRRSIDTLVGRTVESLWVDERVADPDLPELLAGQEIVEVERRGKVVRIRVGSHWLGLHFGMTGRVVVDGVAPIATLEYSSSRDRPEWDRLRLHTVADTVSKSDSDPVPALRLNDPRRLGHLSLDADLGHLGVDIFEVTDETLVSAISHRRTAIKSVLVDQRAVAGLGNLCADEVLWWAGVAPHRSAGELDEGDVAAVVAAISEQLPIMLERGGSTTGVLGPPARVEGHHCPRDGTPLRRDTIGARTAIWCPGHQS